MREPHTAHRLSFMAVVFALLLVACANIGNPDGGPYDETPPKVIRTSPKQGEANVSNMKKIVIEFDEIVKIENAYEKVVISPPQIEQPEIEASGKKVTVTLLDSLKPNMTYTIDFADAIVDNNEGNPLGDYAFTFSTGEQTDTLQVSGHVLNASNLEPIKGILVGLYRLPDTVDADSISDSLATAWADTTAAALSPDSLFRTTPFERISRTDGSGHFIVKGIAPGRYRIYALKDQNQNYYYDQRAEMVAFTDRIIEPTSHPDIRPDTVWHDSIHYDSIVMTPYIRYFPDDVTLLAFESALQDRHLLKSERPILQQFSLFFTAPSDTLPKLTGLNFNSEDAFVIDASEKNDTLNYWIKDSLIYNIDTLEIKIDFFATDTTGVLALKTDTLLLVSKLTKERIAKQEKEKYEDWVKEYKQKVKEERRAAKRAEKEGKQEDSQEDVPEMKEGETPDAQEDVPDVQDETVDVQDEEAPDVQEGETPDAQEDTPDVLDETVDVQEEEALEEHKEESAAEEVQKGKTTEKAKKKSKKKKDEDEDIEIPPMPEEFLEYKVNGIQSMAPDRNVDFVFDEPLDSVDLSKIHLSIKVDSILQPTRFLFRQVPGKILTYRLYAEWEPDTTYQVDIDTAAFVNIYGKRCGAQMRTITLKSLETYSTLFVVLQGNLTNPYVQLLDGNDKVVKTIKAQNNKADFYFINPGTYYLRLFCDLNDNGVWDTGDYDTSLQPEPVYYCPKAIALKANWEITEEWNPTARPLAKQKPEKITKQKPDKAKTVKNRNATRPNRKNNK